jgi:hypothetical protein
MKKEFKLGDIVFDLMRGFGTITEVSECAVSFPLQVTFDESIEYYGVDGLFNSNCTRRKLFHYYDVIGRAHKILSLQDYVGKWVEVSTNRSRTARLRVESFEDGTIKGFGWGFVGQWFNGDIRVDESSIVSIHEISTDFLKSLLMEEVVERGYIGKCVEINICKGTRSKGTITDAPLEVRSEGVEVLGKGSGDSGLYTLMYKGSWSKIVEDIKPSITITLDDFKEALDAAVSAAFDVIAEKIKN